MSRDSQGPRKTFSKGGSSDFNKKRSFSSSSDKPKRDFKSGGSSFKKREGDSTEKRSYTKREGGFEGGEKKTYGDREKKSFSSENRTYGKRQDGSFRSKSSSSKSFGDKEKKSYGSDSYEKKPYTKREDGKYESSGPRKSYGDGEKRSYTKREGSSESRPRKSYGDAEKKPYTKREDGKYESSSPRKSYGDGEKKSYGSDSYEKKPYTKREDGKYESSGPRKSFGDREKKSYGSDSYEKKPYAKREDGKYESSDRKPYGDREKKSYGSDSYEKKPYAKREDGKYESSDKKSYGDRKPAERKLNPSEKVAVKSKKAGPKKTSDQQNVSDDAIRLNRYVANAGVCSRREADVLIATGVVTVNGKIVTEMGYKVNPTDVVSYGGVPIKNETKKYLILNKPKDYITTMDDPQERRTVMELVRQACKERLYPVGRLDRNTTGLLLFTNDGDMTAKLTHPKFEVRKVYHVSLDKKMSTEDYRTLCEGVELSDGFIKPDAAEFVGTGKFELGIEIHSGKNRIVRRMFEHLGYEVVKLDRVAFAGLTKKDLPRGKFRFLTEKEISFLKMLG